MRHATEPSPRRRELCLAALGCFAELGAEASIQDLRARTGASIGSLYHHFGSREGVAGAVYVMGLRDYQGGLVREMNGARTARSFVRRVVGFHIDWSRDNRAWARFLIEMRRAETLALVSEEISELNHALRAVFFDRLRPFIDRGSIVELPDELYRAVLVGPAQAFIKQWVHGHTTLSPKEVRGPLAEAAWAALDARRR